MTKLETIKQNYDRALESYRVRNPKLYPADPNRVNHTCGLCAGTVKGSELSAHMKAHEVPPPAGLLYQLTEPFARINGKIAKGAKFIKLLYIVSTNPTEGYPFGRAEVPGWNALNLPDWHKVTDIHEVNVRWSVKKRKFLRTLWIIVIIIFNTL